MSCPTLFQLPTPSRIVLFINYAQADKARLRDASP